MAIIAIPYTFSAGATIIASQHNSNFSTIYNDYNGNITNSNLSGSAGITYSNLSIAGGIVDSDINASAAIADTKLATISTAGKVSGAALTSLSSTPSNAGLIPSANVFPSGIITMWSGTIATIPSGWVLCDGSNSTPDLRNRFIVGAVADSGGVAKTTVTDPVTPTYTQSGNGQLPSTTAGSTAGGENLGLSVTGGGTNVYTFAVTNHSSSSVVNQVTSSFGSGSLNVATYYALAFIMKT